MARRLRPTYRLEVDWSDTGSLTAVWGGAGLPPTDVWPQIQSGVLSSGQGTILGGGVSLSVSGRVSGTVRLTDIGGLYRLGRGGAYDRALSRPHLCRFVADSGAGRNLIQVARCSVSGDARTATLTLTSRYPVLDGTVPDGTTVATPATLSAVATAALTGAAAAGGLTVPPVRATTAAVRAQTESISGERIPLVLHELAVAAVGWWGEDWDGAPHLWGHAAAAAQTRYASIGAAHDAHVASTLPLGLVRNRFAGAAAAPREGTHTLSHTWTVADYVDVRDDTGGARGPVTLTAQLPALSAGASYEAVSAEVTTGQMWRLSQLDSQWYIIGGSLRRYGYDGQYQPLDVSDHLTVGQPTLAADGRTVSVSLTHTLGSVPQSTPWTYDANYWVHGRRSSLAPYPWTQRFEPPQQRGISSTDDPFVDNRTGSATLSAVKAAKPAAPTTGPPAELPLSGTIGVDREGWYLAADAVTVTVTVTYRVSSTTVAQDDTSIGVYGLRPYPDTLRHYTARPLAASLPLYAQPLTVYHADLLLWYPAGQPIAPHTIRMGDRLSLSLPEASTPVDVVVVSLQWRLGPVPSVRLLCLQSAR